MSSDSLERRQVQGTGIPVPGNDIDTDRIIPARFMKCVTFDGLEQYAFHDERFQEELAEVREKYAEPELDALTLRPRRDGTQVREVALLWRPYWLGADGLARPAFSERP